MNAYGEGPLECQAVQDELAELALGTLSGRSRSEVLDHVESCPRCTALLDSLAVASEALLQLAPEAEPTLGFELRFAERLRATSPGHRPRRVRRATTLWAIAAVMVALAVGLGALTTLRAANNPGHSAVLNLTSADLTSHGHLLGEVMLSAGSPAWLFMSIDDGAWSGRVTCDVTLAGGKVEIIGVFSLSGGYGAWGAPLTSPAGDVRSARLVAPNGTVLAIARLSG